MGWAKAYLGPTPYKRMNKNRLSSYLTAALIAGIGSLPFIDIRIMAPGEWFPWFFFVFAIAGFMIVLSQVSGWIKGGIILCLVNAFMSQAPLLSFIAFMQFICACSFFLLISRIKDFSPVYKCISALVLLNGFLLIMQSIGHDPLTNFDTKIYFGTIGQHMQAGSLTVILAAALMLFSNPFGLIVSFFASFVCHSIGAFICSCIGLLFVIHDFVSRRMLIALAIIFILSSAAWLNSSGKFKENINKAGRLGVWKNSISLAMQKPLFGWGIGTYKVMFPALGKIKTIPWKTAHNCWIQIFFETGIIGLTYSLLWTSAMIRRLVFLTRRKCVRTQAFYTLGALTMIITNMLFHFPTRVLQIVTVLIFIIAYCDRFLQSSLFQREVKYGTKQA